MIFDIHADVEVLELSIHQRVDADAADAGLERSGGNRDAVTDFEGGFLAIESTNLRILNQFGVAVAHDSGQIRRRDRNLEIGGVQVTSVFRLMSLLVPEELVGVVVVPVVVVVVLVVLMLSCSCTVALVGGLKPRVRDLSLLTCMMAMSIMTSGRALSRSSTNFSARAI